MRHFPNFANFVTQENTAVWYIYFHQNYFMISEIVNLSLMETKYPICDVTVFFFFSQRSGIQKLFMQYVSVLKDKITIVHIVQVKKKPPEKRNISIFLWIRMLQSTFKEFSDLIYGWLQGTSPSAHHTAHDQFFWRI